MRFSFPAFAAVLLFPSTSALSAGPVEVATLQGVLRSVDARRHEAVVVCGSGEERWFRISDDETLAFDGIRALRLQELEPGAVVEIDYMEAEKSLPMATWIEITDSNETADNAGRKGGR